VSDLSGAGVSGWLEFEGRITPLEWGRATYTILRLPPDIADALASQKARRVEGEINDQPVNLALSRAPVVEGVFLWTGQSLLERLSVEPGELLEIRLRPAPADAVDTPDDLAAALRAAGVTAAWEALTPGRRRGLIHRVETAKTAPTRAKRIAALVAEM
jgi:hypothetical protein